MFKSYRRQCEAREKAEETRASTARLKLYAQKPHLWADAAPRPAPFNVPPLPAERGAGREPWPGRPAARSGAPPARTSGFANATAARDDAPPG